MAFLYRAHPYVHKAADGFIDLALIEQTKLNRVRDSCRKHCRLFQFPRKVLCSSRACLGKCSGGFLNNIKRLQKALPAPPKTVSAAELASSRSNPPLTAKAAASGSVLAYLLSGRTICHK